jgi:hypothetical protein
VLQQVSITLNAFLIRASKKMKLGSVLVLIVISIIFDNCSFAIPDLLDTNFEYILSREILQGYEKSIRPSVQQSTILNVTFGISLNQIIDVDERNMIITTECWLNQVETTIEK